MSAGLIPFAKREPASASAIALSCASFSVVILIVYSFVGGALRGYGGAPPTYLQGKKKTDDGRDDDDADDKGASDMLDK
jgi:hypothetical protein